MLQSFLGEFLQFGAHEHVLLLNSAAEACVPQLAHQLDEGELLLAEDNIAAWEQVQVALPKTRRTNLRLHHVPFHEYTLSEAPATMDAAAMNILYQPNSAWMHYAVQVAAYALKKGGRLYIAGAKDKGILSLGKRVQEIFGNLETLKISKGQRVICAIKNEDGVGEIVAPTLAPFAEGKIDEGTTLLLEALEIRVTDQALDIGCGAGFIGAAIARQASKGHVTLVDSSLASVAAARRLLIEQELTNAQALASNGTRAVREQRFDLIAMNPPFHIGGIQTTSLAERLIREASQIVHPRGRFYLVANRFLKYEPVLHTCFGDVEEIGGNTRFKVLRALRAQKSAEHPPFHEHL